MSCFIVAAPFEYVIPSNIDYAVKVSLTTERIEWVVINSSSEYPQFLRLKKLSIAD